MSESVNLPALGESVTEGTVTRWLKNVGDRVEVDEHLSAQHHIAHERRINRRIARG